MNHRKEPRKSGTQPPKTTLGHTIEALVPHGLEDVAVRELVNRFPGRVSMRQIDRGTIFFDYTGPRADLLLLRTVNTLYLVTRFAVPRPRALLGNEHFTRIMEQVHQVLALSPPGSYRTLHLSAAGSDSAVMRRLTGAIAQETGLSIARDEGNLQIRLRRDATESGWDALIRLSPRPLSARSWRVCDMPGALNAAVAASMVLLTDPSAGELFLNPACGSGTLLIESAAIQPACCVVGCDLSEAALTCAAQNIAASGFQARIETHRWDARHLPLDRNSVDTLCLDLPFGHRVGRHAANRQLYPEILRECARVARSGARCCLLTHQARLADDVLRDLSMWVVERRTRVSIGGLMPTLIVIRKRRGE